MKTATAGMTTHIAQQVTTLAAMWKVTRQDGTVLRFTDHDVDLTYAGETYKASSGFARTSVKSNTNFSVDNTELIGLLNNDDITAADLRTGKYDFALVQFFIVNWQDPDGDGQIKIRSGFLGETKLTDEGTYEVELRGATQIFARTILDVYTPSCRVDLFSPKCGLDSSLFKENGVVDTVSTRQTFSVSPTYDATQTLDPDDSDAQDRYGVNFTVDGTVTVIEGPAEDGSRLRPFLISNSTDLNNMRNNLHAHYALDADIDMSGFGNFPIMGRLTGSLDGRGYAILDITMDGDTLNDDCGLFLTMSRDSFIRRLAIINPTITKDPSRHAGAFLAEQAVTGDTEGGLIEDCYVVGGGIVQANTTNYGAMVGEANQDLVIRRCWTAVPITSTPGTNAGIFIGDANQCTITNCVADTDVAGSIDLGNDFLASPNAVTTAEAHTDATWAQYDQANHWRRPQQGALTLQFFNAFGTIVRSTGTWAADGWKVNQYIRINGTASNDTATGTIHRITGVAGTALVLGGATLVDEGPTAFGANVITTYPRHMDPGRV